MYKRHWIIYRNLTDFKWPFKPYLKDIYLQQCSVSVFAAAASASTTNQCVRPTQRFESLNEITSELSTHACISFSNVALHFGHYDNRFFWEIVKYLVTFSSSPGYISFALFWQNSDFYFNYLWIQKKIRQKRFYTPYNFLHFLRTGNFSHFIITKNIAFN